MCRLEQGEPVGTLVDDPCEKGEEENTDQDLDEATLAAADSITEPGKLFSFPCRSSEMPPKRDTKSFSGSDKRTVGLGPLTAKVAPTIVFTEKKHVEGLLGNGEPIPFIK